MTNRRNLIQRAALTAAMIALTAGGIAALGATSSTASAAPAGASQDAPRGDSRDNQGGTRCIDLKSYRFVNGSTPDHINVDIPGGPLPAGDYTVKLFAHDSYPTRDQTDPSGQTSERIEAYGVVTPDLKDGVKEASAENEGDAHFDKPFGSVLVKHHHADGADSVEAVRICLTPHPRPTTTTAPSTTASTAPSTTAPVTSVPGTQITEVQQTTTTAAQATSTTRPTTTTTARPSTTSHRFNG